MEYHSPIRIVFFSDTHLGAGYRPKQKGENPRADDFSNNFERVVDYAVESRADLLLHAGDMFNCSQPPTRIVGLAYEKLLMAADVLPVLLLAGNHERARLPPSLFLQHPNLHVFNEPTVFRLTLRDRSFAFGGFPYQRNIQENWRRCINQSGILDESTDYRYLCIHQSVEGARVGPRDYQFRRGKDVISAEAIPAGLTAILSGHIHRSQVLNTNSPVIYCGSTERTSFAEIDETKGFYVLRPCQDQMDFMPLVAVPMARLTITDNRDVASIQRIIKTWSASQAKEAIIRIQFEQRPDDIIFAFINQHWLSNVFPCARSVKLSVKGGWRQAAQINARA